MKLPNGFGSVHKLPGNRRKPWRARKTTGWINDYETGTNKQQYITVGYYATQAEAIEALTTYNANPYDIKTDSITFSQVYDKWSDEHFKEIVPSAIRTWKSAYTYCQPLFNMRMKDIRVSHLEGVITDADVGDNTKGRMKSLFNMMFKYAMKHEIVQKDYAHLCDSIKKPRPQIIRIPFSREETDLLWNNLQIPFVDMVLIGIYSGWRPQELAILKIADINLEDQTMFGGLKTDAGRNRIVPIHPKIKDLIQKDYDAAVAIGSEYLFNDPDGQQGTFLTYDKYRGRWSKIMKRLELDHKPHDTRHTFITNAKEAGMDEYILKLIVGHAIEDVTEKVYTHRTLEDMRKAIEKIP